MLTVLNPATRETNAEVPVATPEEVDLRVSAAMRFGCVWVNDHLPFVSEMPHGGFKQSGYGKDLSMYGLEDYTVVEHVMASLS